MTAKQHIQIEGTNIIFNISLFIEEIAMSTLRQLNEKFYK